MAMMISHTGWETTATVQIAWASISICTSTCRPASNCCTSSREQQIQPPAIQGADEESATVVAWVTVQGRRRERVHRKNVHRNRMREEAEWFAKSQEAQAHGFRRRRWRTTKWAWDFFKHSAHCTSATSPARTCCQFTKTIGQYQFWGWKHWRRRRAWRWRIWPSNTKCTKSWLRKDSARPSPLCCDQWWALDSDAGNTQVCSRGRIILFCDHGKRRTTGYLQLDYHAVCAAVVVPRWSDQQFQQHTSWSHKSSWQSNQRHAGTLYGHLWKSSRSKQVIRHVLLLDWRYLRVAWKMLPYAGGISLTRHCVAMAWFPHEPIDAVTCCIRCSRVSELENTGDKGPSQSSTAQETPSLNRVSGWKWKLHLKNRWIP